MQPWKTLKIGEKTISAHDSAICRKNVYLAVMTKVVFNKTPLHPKKEKVQVVKVKGSDLGITGQLRLWAFRGADSIMLRATKAGLIDCPAEVALALAANYSEQEKEKSVKIAMKPLNYGPWDYIYAIGRGEAKQYLFADQMHEETLWPPETEWVFVQPTQPRK